MPGARHPTLEVLGLPDVRAFMAARFLGATARSLLHAAIAWHIFDATGREFWLGMRGLLEFLPVIPVALLGGAIADTRDRRDVVWLARSAALLCAAGLWLGTGRTDHELGLILSMALGLAVAAGFEFPAAQALLPALVPRPIFQNAVVVNATVRNLALVSGPVLMGFLIQAAGVRSAYATGVALYALSLVALLRVRRAGASSEGTRVGWPAIREGVRFVRGNPVILGAMTLDMLAVILADPTVLLAVFAEEILAVGPVGYGLLSAAIALGTLLTTLVLLLRAPFERPGRALLGAVCGFGLAAVLFGISRSFPLSVAALIVTGMADQVSMVTRSTIIQLSTPDGLRGRVNAVNMVFIGASNEFGAAFSGFLAAATSAVFAVVAGGVGCLGVVAGVAAAVPQLRRHRTLHAAAETDARAQSAGSSKRST
jgi:MFS family permease